jgi:hypothetical protein
VSKVVVAKARKDEIDRGQAYEKQRLAELNAQYQELRDQARAHLAAVKGRCGVRGEEDWERIFVEANAKYASGRFLIERLGAERFLEPELMATLTQLRKDLLTGIENPTAVDTMMVDVAIIAYRNLLRVQGWIGDLSLVVECHLFGQEPLSAIHGSTVAKELETNLRRLEEHILLLERCHRMMTRSFAHLEARRGRSAKTSVTVSQAGQVNVDCAVSNELSR